MIISLLVAMDENMGIGLNNQLPWHLSADLKRFKSLTMGHPMIMGRKTYESIGRPLPGRTTIIVTRNPDFHAEGCLVANSIEDAFSMAAARGEQEVFVIGGGELFSQTLKVADRLYLTRVQAHGKADTFFPPYDDQEWVEVESTFQAADEKNEHDFTFHYLIRKPKNVLDKRDV